MNDLFVGWDVGGWNCDKNPKSRDALVVLERRGVRLEIAGRPWRGNLRATLVAPSPTGPVDQLLNLAGIERAKGMRVTIAIDTPLAWPRAAVDLISTGSTISVTEAAALNPYLFRQQEQQLFVENRGPLSVVRDMIGSQSTKGMHFLKAARLQPASHGVWSSRDGTVVAIETYPALALKDRRTRNLHKVPMATAKRAAPRANVAWTGDVHDAIACAIVASLFRDTRSRLQPPGRTADQAEGWIWLPR